MLPITHHRTIHVPHSVAIAAAIAVVIAALSWNEPVPQEATGDEMVHQVANMQDRPVDDKPPAADRPFHASPKDPAPSRRGERSGNLLSELMPLVLPSLPDR